jgi:hypothetical protein
MGRFRADRGLELTIIVINLWFNHSVSGSDAIGPSGNMINEY